MRVYEWIQLSAVTDVQKRQEGTELKLLTCELICKGCIFDEAQNFVKDAIGYFTNFTN